MLTAEQRKEKMKAVIRAGTGNFLELYDFLWTKTLPGEIDCHDLDRLHVLWMRSSVELPSSPIALAKMLATVIGGRAARS